MGIQDFESKALSFHNDYSNSFLGDAVFSFLPVFSIRLRISFYRMQIIIIVWDPPKTIQFEKIIISRGLREFMELVSVILCVYKEPIKYISDAIQSIINQTYKNIQLIIVIDYPDSDELYDFLENVQRTDSRIKLVKNEKNLGLVESLNSGLNHCDGSFIARMDADDISVLCRLEKQLKYLKENELDLVGSWYDTFIDDVESVEGECVHYRTEDIHNTLRIASCLPHPTWLGKREVFIYNKGYRDIKACEDYDFLIRAYQSGFKLGNVPEILLHYRLNPNSISHINNIHQKVVFKYLSKNFKKGSIVSIDDYYRFINDSVDYINLRKAYKCIINTKNKKSISNYLKLFRIIVDRNCLKTYLKYK